MPVFYAAAIRRNAMFGRRVPSTDLTTFCRILRHQLATALPLTKVLNQQAERGPRSVRGLAGRLAEAVKKGRSLSDALLWEEGLLPPLFLALVEVGEETGRLPETLHELERYFTEETRLRRQFR